MADLMENRRLQGKATIDKKLKQNQEFLMKNTLSPQASVWTRWHQQRLLESEMVKDLSKAPNQKYIAVSRSILILTVVCMYVDCEGDCS